MADANPESPVRSPWRRVLRKDVPAGLINAVVSVPDGLASAALAGVNPIGIAKLGDCGRKGGRSVSAYAFISSA